MSLVNSSSAKNFGNRKQESYLSESAISVNADAPTISATISGPTSICQGAIDQRITFSGSGSSTGYTFFYQINGVDQLSVSATSGNTATVNIPTGTAGSFVYKLVKLMVDASNSKDLDQDVTVVVNALPSADFTYSDNQCSGVGVQFTPTLTGSSYTYVWNFGDGTALSTVASPTHEFLSVGCGNIPYQVTLTITDANGCQSSSTKSITIKQKPNIEFVDVNSLFDPFNNCLNASSTTPDYAIIVGNNSVSKGCIASYSIDWGDGGTPTSNAVFPASHVYTKLGSFKMIITALGTNGCSNSKEYTIKNTTNPKGGFISPGTTTNLCAPTPDLKFEIANWGGNLLGTTYIVDFGDGSDKTIIRQEEMITTSYYRASDPSNSSNYPVLHSYKASNCPKNEFIATLTISNDCRTTDFTANSIIILIKPEADFSVLSSACLNSNVLFTNTSFSGYSQNCNRNSIYTWDFGDGSAIEVTSLTLPKNTSHTYNNPGTYTVTLTAENYCGKTSKTQQIVVNPLPTAAISGTATVCQNSTQPLITFTGANGTAPYTFTYKVNGVSQTVKTTSGNSVTVSAPTSTAGTFIYSLVCVQESSPLACSQDQTGTAAVVVNALPTATILGTTNTCLNSVGPLITFTGANGTAPYTFTYNLNGGADTKISTTSGNSVTIPAPTDVVGTFKYNLISVLDASTTACSQLQTGSTTVTINQLPAPMTLTDREYCNGVTTDAISFSNAVPGTTYEWESTPSIGLAPTGTGNIPSFVATNTTASQVVSTIKVTPSANGCPGVSQTFKITVNPSAVVAFSQADQTICSGASTTEVALSSTTVGSAFSWSAVQPAGITGVTTSGTNTIPAQTLVNTTNATISVIYKAKATLAGVTPCAGTESEYKITVNPKPSVAGSLKATICSGEAFAILPTDGGGNSIPAGTKYSWGPPVIIPGAAITGGSDQSDQVNISQTLVNTTSAAATVTYRVTPIAANGCSGSTFDVIVTVNPKPTVTKPNDVVLCNNDPCSEISFTGNTPGAVYNWSGNNSSIGLNSLVTDKIAAFTAVNNGTSPATATITVEPKYTNGGVNCFGTTEQFSITVNPTAQVNKPTDLMVCDGQNASTVFTTKNTGGTTTYKWSNDNENVYPHKDGDGDIAFMATNITTAPIVANIKVTPTYANAGKSCVGSTEEFKITVNPKGQVTNPGNQFVCDGKPISVNFATINTGDNTTYSWTSTNKNIDLAAHDSGTGNLSFVASNFGVAPIKGTITVTPYFGSAKCPGASELFDITVNPSSAVLFSQAPQTICTGDNSAEVTLSSTTADVTFEWNAVQPDGISGVTTSGTNTIPDQSLVNNTNAPIVVEYKAKATVSGGVSCPGNEYIYRITVNPKPVVAANQSATICGGDLYAFKPSDGAGNVVPSDTKYTWAAPVITPSGALTGASDQSTLQSTFSQTLVNTTSAVAKAVYTVKPEANNCKGASFEIVVSVNPKPVVNHVENTTLCNVAKYSELLFAGNVAGAVYKWSSDNTSIGIASSGTDKIQEFTAKNSGTSPVTATVKVTPTYDHGACEGVSEYFTITVNPTGQVDNPGNLEACNAVDNSIHFTTKNTGGNTTYSWVNDTPGINMGIGAFGDGDILYIPVNLGVTDLSTTITVTPKFTNNGVSCSGPSEQFSVVVHPTPTVDKPDDQVVCNGFSTSDIKFAGNISTTTYNWTTNNTSIGLPANATGDILGFNAINNGSSPIVATITVTPVLNICNGNPKTFKITVNPSPGITFQPKSVTLCKDETPLPLSVSCGNSVETPGYQWYSNTTNSPLGAMALLSENAASYTPSSSTVGTMYYFCKLSFPTGGCGILTSDIAAVTVNPYPVISQYNVRIGSGQAFNVKPDDLNGDIAPAGTTYTWSTPNISPAGSISGATLQSTAQSIVSQTLTNVMHGIATVTYTVTPTSGVCKGADFKVVVTVNPPIDPNVVQKNVDCFGANNGSLTTAVEGGIPFSTGDPYIISWTGPTGFSSSASSITDLIPGDYRLQITDDGGLPFIINYTITEPAGIHLETVTNKNVSCFGAANGKIGISASGGTLPYKYAWEKDAGPYPGSEEISNLSPGSYKVSVTDANSCNPQVLVYTITEPALLEINLVDKTNILCFGESTGAVSVLIVGGTKIEVTPGVFDYAYAWSGPNGYASTDKDLTNITAGLYKLVVTDNQGCTQNFSVTITQPHEVKIYVATTPVTCYGANNASIRLTIIGGVAPYQILWAYAAGEGGFQDNYATGDFQNNLTVGNYRITVVDANNCSKSIIINVPDAPIFRIMPVVKNVSCYGANDGSITLNFEGGRQPISLAWSDNSTSGTARNNIGPGTYRVVISDGTPCVIDREFVILEPQPLVLGANVTHALDCNNANSGAINLMVSGGTPPYKYVWSNRAATEDLNNIPAGNYFVTVTDANGCVQTAQYAVARPAPISILVNTVNNFNCETQQVSRISTATVTGGVPPYSLTWSSGIVSGASNEVMQTYQSSFVILDVVDALGCASRYTFDVNVPTLGINYQLVDCNSHKYQFNAIVPDDEETYTYIWDFGDGGGSTIKSPEHTFPTPGDFRVKLRYESASCVSQFTDVVSVESSPVLQLDKLPIFCSGESILLHVSGADTYRWNNNSTTDSLRITQVGNYSVVGTSKAGCTSTLSFKATTFEPYNYTIQSNKDEITTDNPTVQLWSESITYSDYFWNFGDGKSAQGNNQEHHYDNLRDGYYEVKLKVVNPNGCNEFASKKIWTTNTSTNNVFTPNGDGIDDVFMQGWHVKIYNRNGILLYDGTRGWDGTYKGKPVSNDTYFYVLYISTVSGIKSNTGFITVIR